MRASSAGSCGFSLELSIVEQFTHVLCTTISRLINQITSTGESLKNYLKCRVATESIRVPKDQRWTYRRYLDDCKTSKQNTSLMRMSPNEERITAAICPKVETDCNMTLKRNRLTNDELAKNHKATTQKNDESTEIKYVPRIKWLDLSAQLFIHGGCLYGLYLMFTQAKLLTSLWAFITIYTSGFGITAGVHRLWSHKAYKAKWPLRLFLVFLFTITGQKDVYTWALDHRVHHKYSETDADPHDARRGFFFAHVGWLFTTPHPDVVAKRKTVDVSDLEADPIVMWQRRQKTYNIRYIIRFFLQGTLSNMYKSILEN